MQFGQIETRAKPDILSFVVVQLQSTRRAPLGDFRDTAGQAVSHRLGVDEWAAVVELCVVCVHVRMDVVLLGHGVRTSMVWPTLGSRTAKEQNRTANSLRNLPLKKNCKSVKIRQKYGHESVAPFLVHPVEWLGPTRRICRIVSVYCKFLMTNSVLFAFLFSEIGIFSQLFGMRKSRTGVLVPKRNCRLK